MLFCAIIERNGAWRRSRKCFIGKGMRGCRDGSPRRAGRPAVPAAKGRARSVAAGLGFACRVKRNQSARIVTKMASKKYHVTYIGIAKLVRQ